MKYRLFPRDFFTVLALSFHAVFEGLAVGLEESTADVWTMFGAIATHKFIITFCVRFDLFLALNLIISAQHGAAAGRCQPHQLHSFPGHILTDKVTQLHSATNTNQPASLQNNQHSTMYQLNWDRDWSGSDRADRGGDRGDRGVAGSRRWHPHLCCHV